MEYTRLTPSFEHIPSITDREGYADGWRDGHARALHYATMRLREGRGTFGDALDALQLGEHVRVQRSGWNGKGMWLALTPASELPAAAVSTLDGMSTGRVPGPTLRGAALAYAIAEDPPGIRIGAHIDMRAADGSLVIGWLASQTDMLAYDWRAL